MVEWRVAGLKSKVAEWQNSANGRVDEYSSRMAELLSISFKREKIIDRIYLTFDRFWLLHEQYCS